MRARWEELWTLLLPNIRVATAQQLLHFVTKIPRHFLGRNVGKGAEGKADGVHVGVVHVTIVRDIDAARVATTYFFNELVTSVRTS